MLVFSMHMGSQFLALKVSDGSLFLPFKVLWAGAVKSFQAGFDVC